MSNQTNEGVLVRYQRVGKLNVLLTHKKWTARPKRTQYPKIRKSDKSIQLRPTQLIEFNSTFVGEIPTIFKDFLHPVSKIRNSTRETIKIAQSVAPLAAAGR